MPWSCAICTVINDVDSWLACGVCGSPRDSAPASIGASAPEVSPSASAPEAADAPEAAAASAPEVIVIDDDGAGASDQTSSSGADAAKRPLPPATAPAPKRAKAPAPAPRRPAPRLPDAMASMMSAARARPADGRQPPWGDETPVCAIGDVSRCAALLKRFGVVVFRGVVPADDRSRLESLFWDWLEREHEGVDRARPATHAPHVFDSLGHRNSGVVNTGSIGQSDLLWAARQHAGVVDAWRTVWGLDMTEPAATTRQLVTSFDGCGVWRNPCHPAHAGKNVRTAQSWYHLDQNVATHPGFVGYQGALTVWGANGHTGSTVVCPGSHKQFAENCARGGKAGRGSFVRMAGRGDAEYCARTARQVAPLGPGDYVIWDSRVVHCSNGASRNLAPHHVLAARGVSEQPSLLRLALYVAMMPRERAGAHVVEARRRAVRRGATSGHDPLRMRSGAVSRRHAPPPDDSPIFRLV